MSCEAKQRPRHKVQGWACDGEDLVSVMECGPTGDRMPIVCPRAALELVMQREWALGYEVKAFAGGDHYHLCLDPVEAADFEFASR